MASKAINPGLEIILQSLLGTVAAVGSTYVLTLLDKWRLKNPDRFPNRLVSIYTDLKELQSLADETPTKIDDSLVAPLITALETAAKTYKIKLPK